MAGIEFTNEQVYAIYDIEKWWHSATSKQVFEISGKPGTGKTTCIKYCIERLRLKNSEVLYLAYMGKAVARMVQTGLPAKTIHSVIYDYVKEKKRDEYGRIIINEKTGKPYYTFKFILKPELPKKVKLIVVDEGSMVPVDIAEDLLSFGIPIVVLGDLNQLPPVFGKPYFLNEPDVVLNKIMRQAEGNPIVWLCNEVIEGRKLQPGIYGNSAVIRKEDMNPGTLKNADIILTGTNRLRWNINNYIRQEIKGIKRLEYPHLYEKMICRKNNWNMCIEDGVFLMNGITGVVNRVYHGSYNGSTMAIDFQPDFTKSAFRNVKFDFRHLNAVPGVDLEDANVGKKYNNIMEYAYAITTHSSQGSSWKRVLYMYEDFMRDPYDSRKLLYTGISRAEESIVVVI